MNDNDKRTLPNDDILKRMVRLGNVPVGSKFYFVDNAGNVDGYVCYVNSHGKGTEYHRLVTGRDELTDSRRFVVLTKE